jgi:lipoprotein-anchoring transpeptidase ErfK/SrfK
VLIVVSIPTQRLFVFRDGEPWASSPVSTGKRGKETPAGTFPILQKKVEHRSNLYDDAPMPYMQRLTWGGVALHAGRVPGYPASHGCIRLPRAFAEKLYGVTGFRSTVVVVTDEPVDSSAEAALQV